MVAEILEKKEVRLYSLEEYFELEDKAAFKSEFRNGKIVKTSKSSPAHSRIKGRLSFLICLHIEENSQYEVFDSDQNVYIPKYGNSVYPDLSVVSGEAEMYKEDNV